MNAPRADARASTESPAVPSVAGLPVRPFWPMVLYGLLVASAGLALYAERSPDLAPWVGQVAAWAFFAFAVGFAAYRAALVVARRYSPFKAFLQVLIAALFFMLLLFPLAGRAPSAARLHRHALLFHRDPGVRELAAKVIGYEADGSGAQELIGLLSDASPEVRAAARGALVRLNQGADLGAAEAPWKERFGESPH